MFAFADSKPLVTELPESLAALRPLVAVARERFNGQGKASDWNKSRTVRAVAEAVKLGERKARLELVDKLVAFIKGNRLDSGLREALLAAQGFMEGDYAPVVNASAPDALARASREVMVTAANEDKANDETERYPFEVHRGYSPVPTHFVRTALFTSQDSGLRTFKAMGLNGVAVRRNGAPLNETHLQTLTYLSARVTAWNKELGTMVKFSPWEAIKELGWSQNTASLRRLRDALEALAQTEIRVVLDAATDTREDSPLIGKRMTSLDERVLWKVQVMSTFLNAIAEAHMFMSLDTLAVLPKGAPTWLYGFVKTLPDSPKGPDGKPRDYSEYGLDELCETAGIHDKCVRQRRHKLKEALTVLQAGKVETLARGKAVVEKGQIELVETKAGGLRVKSTAVVEKRFEAAIKSFKFVKTSAGVERVQIVKAKKAKAKTK